MIYDCFIFYNELDLLEIRLNVLNDVVDKFVLVEGVLTFDGKPKPLFYQENIDRFAKFRDKIIPVTLENFPRFNWRKLRLAGRWDRDNYSHNAVLYGLKGCADNDTIIFSDVDEIPRPEKVREYIGTPKIKTFYQELYYYYLDYLTIDHPEPNAFYQGYKPWHGPVMGDYRLFKKSALDQRTFRSRKDDQHIQVMDGGWHYSFMGGTEMVLDKLRAYVHTEYMDGDTLKKDWVEDQIRAGKDVFKRESMKFQRIQLEDRAPRYVVENQEKYRHLILGEANLLKGKQ